MYERYPVDLYRADLSGDLGEALRFARLARKNAPQDFLTTYFLGSTALARNRPQEAVDTLADFDARFYYEWTPPSPRSSASAIEPRSCFNALSVRASATT